MCEGGQRQRRRLFAIVNTYCLNTMKAIRGCGGALVHTRGENPGKSRRGPGGGPGGVLGVLGSSRVHLGFIEGSSFLKKKYKFPKFPFFEGSWIFQTQKSSTPQYVRLKRELLGWSGGRDRWGAPRFSARTKKFHPRGRYLTILPYYPHLESIGSAASAVRPFQYSVLSCVLDLGIVFRALDYT